jgi:hypothetical protein
MSMRKIVFLDIDGVLNNVEWRDFARRTNDEVPRELRLSHWLDPKAVARLNRVLERTAAEVVLSSSWRQRGLETIQHMLAGAGFRGKLIDCTPLPEHHDLGLFHRLDGGEERSENYLWPRGFEIQQWLNGNVMIGGIVILDSASMAHLEPWQVRTSLRDGMLDEHIDRACEVLARPGPRNFGKVQ